MLFLEVQNFFNADNPACDSFDGCNNHIGLANVSLLRLFPIVPAAD